MAEKKLIKFIKRSVPTTTYEHIRVNGELTTREVKRTKLVQIPIYEGEPIDDDSIVKTTVDLEEEITNKELAELVDSLIIKYYKLEERLQKVEKE